MSMHTLPTAALSWLSTLPEISHPLRVYPLSPDASFRRYHRIAGHNDTSYLLCQLDPREDIACLLAIHELFQQASIPVPMICHSHIRFLLYEDLGDIHLKTFLAQFPQETSAKLHAALLAIWNIQRIPISDMQERPKFGEVAHTHEFKDIQVLLGKHWEDISSWLFHMVAFIDTLPATTVHRDFHWENMLVHHNCLRIIDYHDAMVGPPTYDVSSLIADRGCYLSHPKDCHTLITAFCNHPASPPGISPTHVWISIALRLLKIIGNFDRLARTVRPTYRQHFHIALATWNAIPWATLIPTSWQHPVFFSLSRWLKNMSASA